MDRRNALQVVVVLLAAAATAAGRAEQPAVGPEPQQGAVVLRNGQILEGRISRAGNLYCVALPYGEIRLNAADVEFCCRDLEDGYRQKRAAVRLGNVHEHLLLAEWCLRQELFDHAAAELLDAAAADPSHPMIDPVQRRLRMAMAPPPEMPPPAVAEDSSPSLAELDRMVRQLPPGAVETFTQTIQPMLMNHCTGSGCHGQYSETNFKLERLPPGRPASRRLTQRNLYATLQWIDRGQPPASRLLTEPIRPHGTAKQAVFTERELAQYRRMVDWAWQIAQRPQPEAAPDSIERIAAEGASVAPAAVVASPWESAAPGLLPPDAMPGRPIFAPHRQQHAESPSPFGPAGVTPAAHQQPIAEPDPTAETPTGGAGPPATR